MKKITKILFVMILALTGVASLFMMNSSVNKVKAEDVYEAADEISISDLKYGEGKDAGYSVTMAEPTYYTYTATAAHKSVKFSFTLNVKDLTKLTGGKIMFEDSWVERAGLVMLRNDRLFIRKDDQIVNDKPEAKYTQSSENFLQDKTSYQVEVGKLYITSGDNQGKYYVYLKVDGTEVLNATVSSDLNKAVIYIREGGINTLSDPKFEAPDEISVNDLKDGDTAVQNSITLSGHKKYSYTANATNKSVVFSFQYKVNSLSNLDCQFHFADGWLGDNVAGCLYLRHDGVFISKAGGGFVENKTAFESKVYNIKLGKLYINSGDDAGKYYTFIMVNDKILKDLVVNTMPDTSKIFMTGSNGDNLFDVDYSIDEYETPDVISVSDLKSNGSKVGTSVCFDEEHVFSYNATAAHKSVVFKFIYEVTAINVDPNKDELSCQFHISDTWLGDKHGAIIWLRDDKNRISKAGGGYIEVDSFAEVKNYNCEIGKLYVTSGTNAEKYYVYLKVEGKVVAEYIIEDMPDKANLFTTGKNKNHMYDVQYTYETAKEISVGDLELEGKDVSNVWNINSATRLTYDNEDHKTNYSLVFKFKYVIKENKQNQFHLTASGKAEGSTQDYIWDTAGSFILGNGSSGNKNHLGKSTSTSSNVGWYEDKYTLTVGETYNVEYGRLAIMNGEEFTGKYYCYIKVNNKLLRGDVFEIPQAVVEGNVVFITSDGKNVCQDANYVDCAGSHTLGDAVAAVAETCDKDGNVKYYWCSNCGKYFSDAEGTTELSTVVVAKHHTIVEVPAVAEDCDTDGNIKYYECSACHKLFSDNAATTEITAASTVIAKHHTLNEVPAVAETCDTDGNIKYYECSACHKLFSDDTAATEITAASTVVAKHHNIIKVDALPESCSSNGYIEHYTCTACGEIYSDAAGTTVITAESLVVAKHHTVRKVEAKDATCSAAGNVEYYHCSACNKNFSNEAATSELATVATAMLEHTFKRGTCTVCGAEDPEYKGLFSGCKSAVSVTGIVGLFALTGLFFAKKKREEE